MPTYPAPATFLEKSFVLRSRSGVNRDAYRSKPVIIKGINEQQQQVFLKKFLKSGKLVPFEEKEKSQEIALYAGQTLAENLGLSVGSKVMLIGLGSQSSSAKLIAGNKSIIDLLSSLDLEVGVIRGIYDTGLQEGFDDYVVISDLKQLQQRCNPMMISGYDANVHKLSEVSTTVKEVTASLGVPFYGFTVFERYANLFEWLKLQKNITPLLIVTITIVAVF